MAGYFSHFGKITYNLANNSTTATLATNIFQRSSFLKEISENTAIAYEYEITDGDTPEVLAHKLYGDPNRHWIILLYNKLSNPLYEFPLSMPALEKYIQYKHGVTLEDSKTYSIHVRKKIAKTISEYGIVKYRTDEYVILGTYELPPAAPYSDTGESPTTPEQALEDTSTVTIGNDVPVVDESFEVTFDDGTTLNQTVTLQAVSYYDYELELNESRRKIKLLDAVYVARIEEEFRKLMRNG